MPKPLGNRKKLKAAAKAGTGAAKPTKAPRQPTARELLDRAEQAIAFDDYDRAKAALQQAAMNEPDNVEVLDALGALLAETGAVEEATQVLRHAIEVAPNEGFEKYMYLGQLLDGDEAIEVTSRGVEVLQNQARRAAEACDPGSLEGLNAALCGALCSLAEMHMAQRLDADVASVSEQVGDLLRRAREAGPSSPEPLQSLASLRYEQGRPEEALQLLRQSMMLWFVPRQDDEDEEGQDGEQQGMDEDELRPPKKPITMSEEMDEDVVEEEEDSDDEDEDELPSYEFRFECAKLLLELDDSTDDAVQVLEDLIAENDSIPHVWQLLGLSYYSGGHLEEAAEVTAHGLALLRKQRAEAGEAQQEDDELSFADLQAAIEDAKQKLQQQNGSDAAAHLSTTAAPPKGKRR